jgi:hypothetical protein
VISVSVRKANFEDLAMTKSRVVSVGLVSVVLLLATWHTTAGAAEPSRWRPLFDGKSLTGWHKVGDGTWTVEEGMIVGRANKTRLYGLLVSDATFRDFSVRLKFKVAAGDSGFYIRTVIKPPDEAHGLQIQGGLPGSGLGGIYESYGRAWVQKPSLELEKKVFRTTGWNDMTIDAHGGHVEVHVNGVKTATLKDDPSRRDGHVALQMHSGNLMHVMFKGIAIRP